MCAEADAEHARTAKIGFLQIRSLLAEVFGSAARYRPSMLTSYDSNQEPYIQTTARCHCWRAAAGMRYIASHSTISMMRPLVRELQILRMTFDRRQLTVMQLTAEAAPSSKAATASTPEPAP